MTGGTTPYVALLGWYALASAATFAVYGWDKSAAKRGRSRTPEAVLHLMALLGGWPGALVGQQVFRHKTRKQPFRALFWATVVVNVVVTWWLVADVLS